MEVAVMDRTESYTAVLQRMIRAETVSVPGEADGEKFAAFRALLWELFPHIRASCELTELEGAALLRWPGRDAGKQPVLFMNHHDVVPADPAGWAHGPFSGDVADGKLWGRGTLDDKGGLFAMLQAADELAAAGFVPDRDIWFETACTEETTGHGADLASKHFLSRDIHFEMVFDEGGDVVADPIGGVKGTFAMVGVGEKSVVNLRFIARSDGGHASTPGKDTPLVRLGKFMAYVEKHGVFETEVSPAIVEMLRRFSPYMGKLGKVTEKADKLKKPLEAVLPMLGPTAGALVSTTIAFTMAGGGEAINAIPREVWIKGDMRCSHHQGKHGSIAAITKAAKKFGLEVEVLESGFESRLADYNGSAFRLVEQAVRATLPQVDECVPYIMTGGSDSRFMDRVSYQCIRFLPFTITKEQMESIHGVNECVDLATLAPAVDYYKYMMQNV